MNITTIGKDCVGCRSCEQACPKKCIRICANKEGFLYPEVDEDKCVDCGICVKKCPQTKEIQEHTPTAVYGVKNKVQKDLKKSASGGIGYVLAQYIIREGGIVFGAAYDADLKVSHIEVTRQEELPRLQSSKYVQSDIGHSYSNAKKYLDEGRTVLFTGTPCQIAGLHAFLGKSYDNLFTVDLVCHGVPSPLFFEKYLAFMGTKMGGKVIAYDFRSKEKKGWGKNYLIKTASKEKTNVLELDRYGKHFVKADCFRECCYQCHYADYQKRPGDLTIGDFWGIQRNHADFDCKLGVSMCLILTDKGQKLFAAVQDNLDSIEVELADALKNQHNLRKPTKRPPERDDFYSNLNSDHFIEDLKVGLEPAQRVKAILPNFVTGALKRLKYKLT